MKLKDGFVLRTVAGDTIVVPTGSALDLNMMITLNDTGKFLWEKLEKGAETEDLVAALLEEYDVDETTAKAHVAAFVEKLNDHGFLAEAHCGAGQPDAFDPAGIIRGTKCALCAQRHQYAANAAARSGYGNDFSGSRKAEKA